MQSRLLKINSAIQQELAKILAEELSGEQGIVTVLAVEANKSLTSAKIYISSVGNSQGLKEFLRTKKGEFQSTIGRRLNLRNTPIYNFIIME